MDTSTACGSGRTATVQVEVWMRPWVSVAGTRLTECTPASNASSCHTPSPLTLTTARRTPPTEGSASSSISSTFHPRRAA